MEPIEENLLAEFDSDLVQASTGKRFANYIIDVITFYLVVFGVFLLWAAMNIDSFRDFEYSLNKDGLLSRVLIFLLYGFYMFVVEAIFKGKSLGKAITSTRAVNDDGSRIGLKQAVQRGLSRIVPFEAFSALGSPSYPWHDKWTHTMVIDERASTI